MRAAAGGGDRARRAFEHAVAREHDAIAVHGRATHLHEELAAQLDEGAAADADPERAPT